MKILHLSDLHIHKDQENNRPVINLFDRIRTEYPEHYLIITGDITDDGDIEQYKNAANILREFSYRLFIVPGNHDFGLAGNFYQNRKARRFDLFMKALRQGGSFAENNDLVMNVIDNVLFIGLDTNLETRSVWDFARGQVGQKQLSSLRTILSNQENKQYKKILYFHHHPFMHDCFMEMDDAGSLMVTVKNKIDVMLFGHRHYFRSMRGYGIKYILSGGKTADIKRAFEITIGVNDITAKVVRV